MGSTVSVSRRARLISFGMEGVAARTRLLT